MTSSGSDSPVDDHHIYASPTSSPLSDLESPVIATDHLGMIADADDEAAPEPFRTASQPNRKRTRRRLTYVSRHFTESTPVAASQRDGKLEADESTPTTRSRRRPLLPVPSSHGDATLGTPPVTPARPAPRILDGVNLDDLSSDSSLTDVPDDIGPDPFALKRQTPVSSADVGTPRLRAPGSPSKLRPPGLQTPVSSSKVRAVKVKASTTARRPTHSPFFPRPHRHRPTFLSTLPFPPLSDEMFGLMQERLAHDPFRLLVATIFLNKTPGERAMPVFFELMARYPTPGRLAQAEVDDITRLIYGLGFQNQRARKCVAMAQAWVEQPPAHGRRYRKLHYPRKGDGRDVADGEVLADDDPRVAWEIAHLPGLGPYSHDSWRIFCRDRLRARADSWNGQGAADPDSFEPEWKRVVPLDKELRAYLTWMWLKEGWAWNKETGDKSRADEELLAMARGGGVVVEEADQDHLRVMRLSEDATDKTPGDPPQAAGRYLPDDDLGES